MWSYLSLIIDLKEKGCGGIYAQEMKLKWKAILSFDEIFKYSAW